MEQVNLGTDGLNVSRFIFGTASLFNVGRPKDRQNLLFAAVEAGFSHFDTAPYYGFGLAERDLAPVLKAHPHVTFTTKVGIYSPGGENQSDLTAFLRKATGRFVSSISRPNIDFSVARAKTALSDSLKRTGRDCVDLYTLHEPEIQLLETEEWQRWLEDCRLHGSVREFGLALTVDRLEPLLRAGKVIGNVIQLCDSLADKEADVLARFGRHMQITYGYVSAELQRSTPLSIPEIHKRALKRNPDGAIIVSTTKASRLMQYTRFLDEARHVA